MNIALIGNQNCGKTTLFNLLTGSNQKIGNWPGVTIEKKEGKILKTDIELVDLPGIYSLSPYTLEENVSRDFLINDSPDLIINVVDSTSLERSLYLTTQLKELGIKMIIVLNMVDLLEKRGLKINCEVLSRCLGLPVIQVSALKRTGIDELLFKIKNCQDLETKTLKIFPAVLENEISQIEKKIDLKYKRFAAIKLLENDSCFSKFDCKEVLHSRKIIETIFKMDAEQTIANERYNFISKVKKECVSQTKQVETISNKIDKIVLNRWLAIPIFALVITLVYCFSVGVIGKFTTGFIESAFEVLKNNISNLFVKCRVSNWCISLTVDGLFAGVGSVLVFVPQLIALFFCISILETSGYMSRIAFMFDRLFFKFGLSGKSLVPFIVGSGCSVPAIMSCKTIENADERQMTIMLTPFVPCSAKLPIIALFSGFFFPNNNGLISASLYFLAVLVICVSALILKNFIPHKNNNTFISELPEYKMPSAKYVFKDVKDKVKNFIIRAGTIILLCSVVIWFLSSFGWNLKFGVSINNSILAGIGNAFGWFFYPILGEWNWAASVSAIQGLIAKEQVVSSMTIIAGVANGSTKALFSSGIFSFFSKASAYSFVVFNLFSAPCVGAISAMKNEFGSTKKMLFAIIFQIIIAWILSSVCFCLLSFVW